MCCFMEARPQMASIPFHPEGLSLTQRNYRAGDQEQGSSHTQRSPEDTGKAKRSWQLKELIWVSLRGRYQGVPVGLKADCAVPGVGVWQGRVCATALHPVLAATTSSFHPNAHCVAQSLMTAQPSERHSGPGA